MIKQGSKPCLPMAKKPKLKNENHACQVNVKVLNAEPGALQELRTNIYLTY